VTIVPLVSLKPFTAKRLQLALLSGDLDMTVGVRHSHALLSGQVIMAATRGHVVKTPAKKEPYKIVLEHEVGPDTEESVSSVKEGERLIRQETPTPPKRDTTLDRPATDT
jgi:hypothetical protein